MSMIPAFLASLRDKSEGELTLHFTQKNAVDCRPLSLFSHQTLAQLEQETGLDLDKRRFRANFYVDWDSAEGFLRKRTCQSQAQGRRAPRNHGA